MLKKLIAKSLRVLIYSYICTRNMLDSSNILNSQSDQSLCFSLEYSMRVKLLIGHHLEFQAAQASLSRRLSKCHIVGNHVSRLKYKQ